MTEFSFDLFIASVPIKVISKFDHVVLENLNIYRMRNRACVLDRHWGNVLARPRSPILVTYNGIHAQLQKTEGGQGAEPLEKDLLAMPFRLLENTFSTSSSIPGFLDN